MDFGEMLSVYLQEEVFQAVQLIHLSDFHNMHGFLARKIPDKKTDPLSVDNQPIV